jgi:hypothetical protein
MSPEDFDNIPSRRLSRLASEFRAIKARIARLTERANEIRDEAVNVLGVGTYESCTVYEVASTKVKEHKRNGYKAIRARSY